MCFAWLVDVIARRQFACNPPSFGRVIAPGIGHGTFGIETCRQLSNVEALVNCADSEHERRDVIIPGTQISELDNSRRPRGCCGFGNIDSLIGNQLDENALKWFTRVPDYNTECLGGLKSVMGANQRDRTRLQT